MKRDGEGALIGIAVVIGIIAFIVYIIVMIAAAIALTAAVVGLAIGGGFAVVNYCKSFKENMINSNRKPTSPVTT